MCLNCNFEVFNLDFTISFPENEAELQLSQDIQNFNILYHVFEDREFFFYISH